MTEPQPATAIAATTDACCIRGCKVGQAYCLVKCYMCDKKLHQECCDQKVIAKNNLDTPRDPDGNLVAVCTKTCWKALEKSMTKGLRLLWGRDGKNGENDPNSSEAILLNWLTEADNYNRYRGKGNEGKTKIEFCQDIANIINAAGVVKNRSADDVKKKIETLEKQMRKAAEWASQTGAGLMESGNQTAFREFTSQGANSFNDALTEKFRCALAYVKHKSTCRVGGPRTFCTNVIQEHHKLKLYWGLFRSSSSSLKNRMIFDAIQNRRKSFPSDSVFAKKFTV